MARIFIEGFESGGLENWDLKSGGATVETPPTGMSGSYAVDLANELQAYLRKDLGTTYTAMYFALKVYFTSSTGGGIITLYDAAGTQIFTLMRNASSSLLEVRRGSYTGTLLATGTTTITNATTFLIELYYVPLNSGGTVQVKVNLGSAEINYSGDTTNGNESFRHVLLGQPSGGGYAYNYIDDFVMDDAGWIGNTRIQGLVPTGAGTTTQWDPSAGSNYACVDERPASDSDYVSTNVTDEIDTYATGNMTGAIDSIKCVQIQARCGKDGVPTPTQLQLAVRSGGTNYFSASKAVPSVFGVPVWAIWEDNPADSADWEEADVNGMEIGIKAVA